MMMNAEKLYFQQAPFLCGAHPSCGERTKLIVLEQEKGNPAFSRDKFPSARDWVIFALGFTPAKGKEGIYNQIVDMATYGILLSDKKNGKTTFGNEIESYEKMEFSPEEKIIIAQVSEWWNA